MQSNRLLVLSFAVSSLAAPSSAQTIDTIRTFSAASFDVNFGAAVTRLDDITGDGKADFAIGSPTFDLGIGAVFVYSSADGSLVHTLFTPTAIDPGFGFSVGDAGDVNGDGVTDIVAGGPAFFDNVATPGVGVAAVYSGSNGDLLYPIGSPGGTAFGWAVTGLGDVNADGFADFAISSLVFPDITVEAGRVTVFSGGNGSILYEVDGAPGDRLGASLADLDDLDNDGVRDLAIGAVGAEYVRLVSGATGATILTLTGPAVVGAQNYGFSVDGTGDLDGDGRGDVIVGAPRASGGGVLTNAGRAFVQSSATGAVIHVFTGGFTNDFLGWDVSGADDLDFDGTPDLLVGAPMFNNSSFFPTGGVAGFSGRTGSSIFFASGTNIGAAYGSAVDFVGDTTGDGFQEFLGGQPGVREARHQQFEPGNLGTNYCVSTPNSTGGAAVIFGFGSTSVAENAFSLFGAPLPPNVFGQFYYGPTQIQVPFGNGFRCVGAGLVGLIRLPVTNSSPGGTMLSQLDFNMLSTTPGPITPGSTWNFQGVFRDNPAGGAGFDLTDGLEVTFAP